MVESQLGVLNISLVPGDLHLEDRIWNSSLRRSVEEMYEAGIGSFFCCKRLSSLLSSNGERSRWNIQNADLDDVL